MEASQAEQQEPVDVPDTSKSELSVFDNDQEPTGAEDQHGTHTPSSSPPASAQSGDPLAAATKAAVGGQKARAETSE